MLDDTEGVMNGRTGANGLLVVDPFTNAKPTEKEIESNLPGGITLQQIEEMEKAKKPVRKDTKMGVKLEVVNVPKKIRPVPTSSSLPSRLIQKR